MEPRYLRVKNWDRFQHYKSRENAPSWIKMYPDLLLDYQFQKLGEADRYRIIGIWLLAGKLRNRIPFDAKFVAKAIDVRKVNLEAFVRTGWLELVDDLDQPVSIDSLDTVYDEASEALALGEQSRKAVDKGREADGDSDGRVYTLPAIAEIDIEVQKLLRLTGCDSNSEATLTGYARQLPLSVVADIRTRAVEQSKSVKWACSALKSEVEERSAA
jgi:hypothetical protein